MLTIPGIIASANYPRVTSSYESIATVTVGAGGSSTISFTSIPSTYKHLQIRGIARNTSSSTTFEYTTLRINSDTGNSYTLHYLSGDGGSPAAGGYGTGTVTYAIAGYNVSGGNTSGMFGTTVIDILDYANNSKFKTIRSLGGYDKNGAGSVGLLSGLWTSTSAITSITLGDQAANFAEHSKFALYGVKG